MIIFFEVIADNNFKKGIVYYFRFGLNIFYSGTEYTEMDWVRLKVRHYPLQFPFSLCALSSLSLMSMFSFFNVMFFSL